MIRGKPQRLIGKRRVGYRMAEVNSGNRLGDQHDSWRQRLVRSLLQLIENLVPFLGQTLGQQIVYMICRSRRIFSGMRPASSFAEGWIFVISN